jgi:hypothetical protein
MKVSAMRAFGARALISVGLVMMATQVATLPARAQSAADAALNMANMLDGAGGGVSSPG